MSGLGSTEHCKYVSQTSLPSVTLSIVHKLKDVWTQSDPIQHRRCSSYIRDAFKPIPKYKKSLCISRNFIQVSCLRGLDSCLPLCKIVLVFICLNKELYTCKNSIFSSYDTSTLSYVCYPCKGCVSRGKNIGTELRLMYKFKLGQRKVKCKNLL